MVYPPVDTEFYRPDATVPTPTALVVSALVPYKRIDVAIDACRLAGVPLRIVGSGPEAAQAAGAAGPGVEFLGTCTDEEIRDLYREAGVVLLPGEEDFGIVPVEAQACGRPVVALARGGALETVVDGVTGVLVASESPEAFAAGIRRALDLPLGPGGHPAARGAVRPGAVRGGVPSGDRRDAVRPRGRGCMVKRYNRLLVAFHVCADAVAGRAGVRAGLRPPVRDRPAARVEGLPAVRALRPRPPARRPAS